MEVTLNRCILNKMIYSRFEQKYLLNFNQYIFLQNQFNLIYTADSNSINNSSYPVFSQYFDTTDGRLYQESLSGDLDRLKVRIRAYCSNFEHQKKYFLEFKEKDNTLQKKTRALHSSYSQAYEAANQSLLRPKKIAPMMLFPTVNVYFERMAYVGHHQHSSIRINFDTNLLALLPFELKIENNLLSSRRIIPQNSALMEIKTYTPGLPDAVTKILAYAGVHKINFSKYVRTMKFINLYKETTHEC